MDLVLSIPLTGIEIVARKNERERHEVMRRKSVSLNTVTKAIAPPFINVSHASIDDRALPKLADPRYLSAPPTADLFA